MTKEKIRVMARETATELSMDEIAAVSGGLQQAATICLTDCQSGSGGTSCGDAHDD